MGLTRRWSARRRPTVRWRGGGPSACCSRRRFPQPRRPPARGGGQTRPRWLRLSPSADHAAARWRPNGRSGGGERECAGRPWAGGSVIRHAAALAVGALAVAVVEAAFEAALVAGSGGAQRAQAAGLAAGSRAVGVAAVTGGADAEGPLAGAAGSAAERVVHGVGARKRRSDWTTERSRGTNALTGRLCRSAGRSRGSGGHDRALTRLPELAAAVPQRVPAIPAG